MASPTARLTAGRNMHLTCSDLQDDLCIFSAPLKAPPLLQRVFSPQHVPMLRPTAPMSLH